MRYVAKIHVLDVMDRVVVSGYVVDCDPMTDPDHEALEFSYDTLSYGRDDPIEWLTSALYGALVQMQNGPSRAGRGAAPTGGPQTISDVGDKGQ